MRRRLSTICRPSPGTAGRRKIPPSPEGCTIYTFIYQYTLVAFLGHPALYVFCLSCDFGFYREKATHMELLQKSSLFGRRKLFYFKFLTLLLYFIPFCLLGAVLRLIWSSSHYRLDWDAPANCLEIFRETGITCSIRSIFFLGTLLQCIFVVLALLLLSRLAELSKDAT